MLEIHRQYKMLLNTLWVEAATHENFFFFYELAQKKAFLGKEELLGEWSSSLWCSNFEMLRENIYQPQPSKDEKNAMPLFWINQNIFLKKKNLA